MATAYYLSFYSCSLSSFKYRMISRKFMVVSRKEFRMLMHFNVKILDVITKDRYRRGPNLIKTRQKLRTFPCTHYKKRDCWNKLVASTVDWLLMKGLLESVLVFHAFLELVKYDQSRALWTFWVSKLMLRTALEEVWAWINLPTGYLSIWEAENWWKKKIRFRIEVEPFIWHVMH